MTDKDFFEKYNIKLNDQQMEAVRAVNGSVLLLAVPGSGKTTVLVTRLGYMIKCCNIAPQNILTITYTVAATKDMESRYKKLFKEDRGYENMSENSFGMAFPEFRTINGICTKIIMYYSRLIGKKPFELITNEKQITAILSEIYLKVEREYPTESDIKSVRTQITYIKNMMLSADDIKSRYKDEDIDIPKIYEKYKSQLRERGLMDYDDQMVFALNILRISRETMTYFQNQYPYICVDEAQDTSKIQHEIIKALSSSSGNIFMVGDEDQSIYGFRAAFPDALLDFEKDHPGASVLLMEKNYRSDKTIVDAAQRFISLNKLRHEKHMIADNPAVNEINVVELSYRSQQYNYLLKVAQNMAESGKIYSEHRDHDRTTTAVLYRDTESIIPFINMLENEKIAYRIRSNEAVFFTNRLVMDIKNIIQFAYDDSNTELFMKVYFKIGLFMSKQVAQNACELSAQSNKDILATAYEYCDMPAGTRNRVKEARESLSKLRKCSGNDIINSILYDMKYYDYMDRMSLNENKISILRSIAYKEVSALSFLNRLDELQNIMQNKEPDYNCNLILSTIHGSKGLEYDNVFIIDALDGVFPESIPYMMDVKKNKEEMKLYEEERRLFYVAATRAKNKLTLLRVGRDTTFIRQLVKIKEKSVSTVNKKKSHFAFGAGYKPFSVSNKK